MSAELAVVVPSHARPLRLRRLLDALEDQTLARARWELVVVHDDDGEQTETLLRDHRLARAGVLRHLRMAPGTGTAARQRNAGWRAARAPLVAFTDDDCRPEARWLERLLAAAQRAPGAIVQGATRPDPDDAGALGAPRVRTLSVDPPTPECPTCNALYPRALLELLGGFDERFPAPAGEDTDLAQRARAAGAALVAAPDALVLHAVEAYSLVGMARLSWKWQHLALLVKRHPGLRERVALRVFWKPSHWRLALAALGAAGVRRAPALALLALPYLRYALTIHGTGPRGVARATRELPSRVAVDAVEFAALARGSARYRTLLL